MNCTGFAFIFVVLECTQPTPPTTAGAQFCQTYKPIYWHASDTRQTKEQIDEANRVWKRLCQNGASAKKAGGR